MIFIIVIVILLDIVVLVLDSVVTEIEVGRKLVGVAELVSDLRIQVSE